VVGYGASIVLHLVATRGIGAARQAALFATAPFIGAVASVPLLGDKIVLRDLVAGSLMAAGLALRSWASWTCSCACRARSRSGSYPRTCRARCAQPSANTAPACAPGRNT
jgi:drug/metabolite transporter (DMT)-like permease